MDPADEDKFDFDPLDVTKIWPEDLFPLQPVGRLVLNKNVDNFFAENEQLAFAPGVVVPGALPFRVCARVALFVECDQTKVGGSLCGGCIACCQAFAIASERRHVAFVTQHPDLGALMLITSA